MGGLPDFLVIGAYKSGTTSLIDYLGRHPDVYVPWLQEPNFFTYDDVGDGTGPTKPEVEKGTAYLRHRTRTLAQYQALFADAPPGAVKGECSPEYMRDPTALNRIKGMLPGVRLVAILRNPVDRAFSDWQAFVRDGLEQEPFDVAIRRPQSSDLGHQYVHTGFYGAQLAPFYDAFGADRLCVLLNEDLRADRDAAMSRVCRFLGVRDQAIPDLEHERNVSGRPRNRAVAAAYRLRRRLRPWLKPIVPAWAQRPVDKMLARGLARERPSEEARRYLVELYRDDVLRLQALIDRDLSHWLTPV